MRGLRVTIISDERFGTKTLQMRGLREVIYI